MNDYKKYYIENRIAFSPKYTHQNFFKKLKRMGVNRTEWLNQALEEYIPQYLEHMESCNINPSCKKSKVVYSFLPSEKHRKVLKNLESLGIIISNFMRAAVSYYIPRYEENLQLLKRQMLNKYINED